MDYDKIIKRQNTTNAILNVLQYPAWACLLEMIVFSICSTFGYKPVWLIYSTVIAFFSLPVILLLIIIFGIYSVWLQHLENKALSEE